MSQEGSDSGEKEFEASEQKKLQARQDGDVAQSKEANTLALIVGIACAALLLQYTIGEIVFSKFSAYLYHTDRFSDDVFNSNGTQTVNWLVDVLVKISPLFIVLFVIILLALILQRAIAFSPKKIKPDVSKLSPMKNLKQKYGPKGLLDFLKDTSKLFFAGAIAITFIVQFTENYYASSAVRMGQLSNFTFTPVFKLILIFGLFQTVLAVIDIPLQKRLHANKLKMSREDMKKEMKQSEGDPHLKQARREKASKISRGEMIDNVKTATVIMVNPEHYAVALKWDPDSNMAPICVAKGIDHMAARIRETALAHNVPIYRDPPSTRALYRLVDIDEEIRPESFAAVAAAIQFVERVRKHM